MNSLAGDHWQRAREALAAARQLAEACPDSASSRAYYAAFHAVSAYFASQGRTFRKHTEVRAAVHRDLVKAGLWPVALGERYTYLLSLRETGDYGGSYHVSSEEAGEAAKAASEIIAAVERLLPEGA